jgi:probable phosphoglycerate mutase
MVTQVLLARHGQTLWNTQGRKQGQLDSPLTDLGVAQAHHNAQVLSDHAVDAVFASPLGRAVVTAGILAQALGLAVEVVDDLAEMNHGTFAGMTNAEIEAAHPGALAHRRQDKYEWRFPGGESYADADRRAATALAKIATYPTNRPLIVSHAMIGRMLLRNLLGLRPAEALALAQPNDVVHLVDCAAGTLARIGGYPGSL